jgi:dihydrolipoamide dehydrogenase
VARVLTDAREAVHFGVEFPQPEIDIDRLRSWKEQIVQNMTEGLSELCNRRNISFIQGRANFIDSNTLRIDRAQGGHEELRFDHAILATGSKPAHISNLSFDSPRILDSTTALELIDIPKRMLVVGGGYIGLELGTVYASLGTRISVVEMTSGLLPGTDRDLVNVLAKRLRRLFSSVMLNTQVVDMKEDRDGIRVRLKENNTVESEQIYEKVLITVGRKPNTIGLGLENTKVKLDDHGFVVVDEGRRTTDPAIFAIGDIAGEPMLAHKAMHEGHVAAQVILGHKISFEPKTIPTVVFTDPEVAYCGLTETQARQGPRSVKVTRFAWGASGKARILGRNDGLTKLIIDRDTERVLAMGIVGAGAGELISEGVLAIEMGALVSDLRLTIHPHPTLSETIMESAQMFSGQCTHMYRPGKS